MGSDITEEESYRKMFFDGLSDLRIKDSIINYDDFLLLMKGQTKEPDPNVFRSLPQKKISYLNPVPESSPLTEKEPMEEYEKPSKVRAKSFECTTESTIDMEEEDHLVAPANACRGVALPEHQHDDKTIEDLIHDESKTPLVVNRSLYRAHRQMRIGVLEACKRFDEWQQFRLQQEHQRRNLPAAGAGLVMKHGTTEKLTTEAIRKILQDRQKEQQKLLDKANKLAR